MPSDLSAADIAEGRRLDAAATPGPWGVDTHEHLEKGCRCASCYDTPTVTQTTNMLECQDVPPYNSCEQSGYSWSDAELIVWARNHLPALLDAAEKVAELESESLQAARYDVWLKCHRGITDSDWNEFLEADSGE